MSPPATSPAALQGVRDSFLDCLGESSLITWYWPDVSKPMFWCPGGFLIGLGYPPGDEYLSTEKFLQHVHPDDRRPIDERIHARVSDGTPHSHTYEADFRLRRADGHYVWVRSTMSIGPRSPGQPRRAFGVTRVIGETRRLEASRPEVELDPLYAVMNEIGHPVILMSASGVIVQANHAAARAAGDRVEALPAGTPCPFLHEPGRSPAMASEIARVISLRERRHFELERFGRWWDIHLVPVPDANGIVGQMLLLASDVTAAKAHEREKLESERSLTQALVREVHHRIKNHLQGLVGLMRMHQGRNLAADEIVSRSIAQIRSIATVHGLLARHSEHGVDLHAMLVETVRLLEHDRPDGLRIELQVEPDLVVDLDPEHAVPVALAIGELVTNAAKHTVQVEGATIGITLRNPDPASAEIIVSNRPANLAPDFALQDCRGSRGGLDLIQSLLPSRIAHLELTAHDGTVSARLRVQRSSGLDQPSPS
jgi:two-component sensor histidine kinase/PAS domain-containing protein